jgi:hypothetical protein
MSAERFLNRLAQNVTPSDTLRQTVKNRMEARIHPKSADILESVAESVTLSSSGLQTLKDVVMGRLQPIHVPVIGTGFKWAATFVLIVLAARMMPPLLLPTTQAEVGVQLVPSGEGVSIYIGGVWRDATEPQIINSAVMVKTGASSATLVVNDDGVLRLGPNTTVKFHNTAGSHFQSDAPAATLIRGQLWALGLRSPIVDGLILETSYGNVTLNSGSVSIEDNNNGSVTVAVYDRGMTLQHGEQASFLIAGEKAVLTEDKTFDIQTMRADAFNDDRVVSNLSQDAVHRAEIVKMMAERRTQMAGILPTSFLYPAKRIAEEVDVLFTLTHDGRTEKRIGQANTRLNEALALIKEGQSSEAAAPLTEYKDSLVALASSEDDNLVKYLIKKQIADASMSLSGPDEDPQASVQLLTDAVIQVGAAIPDADLKPRDVEGYVLVDRLAQINQLLAQNSVEEAAAKYSEISPYLPGLLSGSGGAHPLLQKEAQSFLVSTSSLLKKVSQTDSNELFVAMEFDVSKHLPPEPEKIEELNTKRDVLVEDMRHRIIDNLITPGARYRQLLVEMDALRTNPDRGTLLRRLKAALPERLGEYVNTEIKLLGDELKDR